MRAILLATVTMLAFTLEAQKSNQPNIEHYKSVYQSAIEQGDLDVATNAIYHIRALQPKAGNWKDTLARVYFSNQKFGLAKNIAEEILQDEPDNIPLRTVAAYSNKRMGRTKEAIPHFEKLYAGTQNLNHLYDLIVSQFSLRRYGECASNINTLLENKKASEIKTRVQVSREEAQEVPLSAAALNIKGVISLEMGNKEHAKKFFEQSLGQMEDFMLPRQNLKSLNQQKNEKGKEKEAGGKK